MADNPEEKPALGRGVESRSTRSIPNLRDATKELLTAHPQSGFKVAKFAKEKEEILLERTSRCNVASRRVFSFL